MINLFSSFLLIFEVSAKSFLNHILLYNLHVNTQHALSKINILVLFSFYLLFYFILVFIWFTNFPNLFILNLSLFIKTFFIQWVLRFNWVIRIVWIDCTNSLYGLIWILCINRIKWINTYFSSVVFKSVQ